MDETTHKGEIIWCGEILNEIREENVEWKRRKREG